MNSDVLLIVLTENSWLYVGLTALLPEMNCVLLKFNAGELPDNVMHAGRVMVVVDSLFSFGVSGEVLIILSLTGLISRYSGLPERKLDGDFLLIVVVTGC